MKYIYLITVIVILCVGINLLQLYFKMSNLFSFAATVKQQVPTMLDKIQKLQSQLRYHPSQKLKSQLQKLQSQYNYIHSPEGQAALQQNAQMQQQIANYEQQQAQQQHDQAMLDLINSAQDVLQHPPKRIKPIR